jgi:hypothetical protein
MYLRRYDAMEDFGNVSTKDLLEILTDAIARFRAGRLKGNSFSLVCRGIEVEANLERPTTQDPYCGSISISSPCGNGQWGQVYLLEGDLTAKKLWGDVLKYRTKNPSRWYGGFERDIGPRPQGRRLRKAWAARAERYPRSAYRIMRKRAELAARLKAETAQADEAWDEAWDESRRIAEAEDAEMEKKQKLDEMRARRRERMAMRK